MVFYSIYDKLNNNYQCFCLNDNGFEIVSISQFCRLKMKNSMPNCSTLKMFIFCKTFFGFMRNIISSSDYHYFVLQIKTLRLYPFLTMHFSTKRNNSMIEPHVFIRGHFLVLLQF